MAEERQIEVYSHTGGGYAVMMDFDAWRIGYLRHASQYLAPHIESFQRHESCDEAFVLLRGRCCLLTGGGGENMGAITGTEMEPYRVYNIPKGVWHSHLVDKGTDVLVVENSDVTLENSPLFTLSQAQRGQIEKINAARKARRNFA